MSLQPSPLEWPMREAPLKRPACHVRACRPGPPRLGEVSAANAVPELMGAASYGPTGPGGRKLRAWQTAALSAYVSEQPVDYLLHATPGAGKTSFALTVAARLLAGRVIDRIVVVCPTDHLRNQWAQAAAGVGVALD